MIVYLKYIFLGFASNEVTMGLLGEKYILLVIALKIILFIYKVLPGE